MERWTTGYSALELREAEKRFGLRFPPDLFELLRQRRPVQGYDWLTDQAAIERALLAPLEGILFDVENGFWRSDWGERPGTAEGRAEMVTEIVWSAPRLIPILGHRYLPEIPDARGNPVFSVMQSDVIYYGRDLDDYFAREFSETVPPLTGEARYIPFWSDLAAGDA